MLYFVVVVVCTNFLYAYSISSHLIPNASSLCFLMHNTQHHTSSQAYCIPVVQKILAYKSLIAERGGEEIDSDNDDSAGDNGGGTTVKGVILVPTRELCNQVAVVLDDLTYYCADEIKVVVLSSSSSSHKKGKKNKGGGDASAALQQEALLRDRPDIVVATPAGLVNHVRNGQLNLKKSVETLVVDEADLILSFGK